MNKRQKEVIRYNLDNEKAVLNDLEKQYRKALADIDEKIKLLQADELTQSRIYQLQYQNALKKQVEAIIEKLHADEYSTIQQYLSTSYTNSFVGVMYDIAGQGMPIIAPIDQKAAVKAILTDSKISEGLYTSLGVDTVKLKKNIRSEITRGIAAGQDYAQIARNLSNASSFALSRAKAIVRTEGHRIQQASADDARQTAKSKGADVVKQWDATMDGATRPTHRELDGQIREVDEYFQANGKKAKYPGDFGDPAEDCECRCEALTRARAAMNAEELQTLKDRAKYFGLDKTKGFDDFKEKFLKAAELLKKQGKSGIINAGKFMTVDDPMREVTGAGLESNPKEIKAMMDDLESAGVEIVYRANEMAYAQGLRYGEPGQLIINKEASYSAWAHEYRHFCDDRDDGYLGMRIFMDIAKCKQREINAYQAEIELAEKAKRPDIVDRLKALMKKEVSKYDATTEDD